MTSARHFTLFALGLLGLLFVFAGCDSDDLDDRNNGVIVDNDIRVFTFTLNDQDRGEFRFDRVFSTSEDEVQYETDSQFYPQLAALLTERTVNQGVVLLYISDVLSEDGLRRDGWTALPLTVGVDLPTEEFPDGDGLIDYTVTTTYTYGVGRLYVNVAASDVITIGELDADGRLDAFEDLRLRLVALPGGGFNRGIDYSDYEAVKRAYNLPD